MDAVHGGERVGERLAAVPPHGGRCAPTRRPGGGVLDPAAQDGDPVGGRGADGNDLVGVARDHGRVLVGCGAQAGTHRPNGQDQLAVKGLGSVDRMLALFEGAGFETGEADLAISAVIAYVLGISISEAVGLTSLARSGLTEAQWLQRLTPAVEHATKDYPRLRDSAPPPDQDPQQARDDNYQYGLERMLDGLQARLDG